MSTRRGGAQGGVRRGEVRLPAGVAALVAVGLYALLPPRLLLGGRYVVPALEVALLITVTAVNPYRITRQNRLARAASVALVIIVAATNLFALGRLIADLVTSHPGSSGGQLSAALAIWTTNVIAFALAFWELDRGGPVSRTTRSRGDLPRADFRFSQDEDADAVDEVAAGSSEKGGWVPAFVDYLYVSLTNSSAFSPTDTMPLSPRAKVLMGVEATAALMTSLLIVAHAVGSLQ